MNYKVPDRVRQYLLANYEPVTESGCWIWMRAAPNGYGQIWNGYKVVPAHRLSWEIYHDQEMPAHLDACHSCDVCECINPAHIWPGTVSQNILDAIKKGRFTPTQPTGPNKGKTHCVNGHEFTERNTYLKNRGTFFSRHCRICACLSQQRYQRRLDGLKQDQTTEKEVNA
jgi:hypothetical protein